VVTALAVLGAWHGQKGDAGEEQNSPREWQITEIGRGPMLDAEDIQKHLDAGTLADEIALMTTVHKFPWPIEIVEVEMRCGMCDHHWTPVGPVTRCPNPNCGSDEIEFAEEDADGVLRRAADLDDGDAGTASSGRPGGR
jgi:Zn finger protein HypA/HybF involved in hydrogenase expression